MTEGEKQGHAGNLQAMTLPQLRELLHRQEKMLAKQNFLSSLPDGGQKVKHFVEKLQKVIAQRQQSNGSSFMSDVKDEQVPQKRQTPLVGRSELQTSPSAVVDNIPVSTPVQATQSKKTQAVREGDGRKSQGDGEEVDMTATLCERLDTLAVSESSELENMNTDGGVPGDGGNVKIHFPNSYESVMKRNAASSPKRTFKPHSSLKVTDVKNLPDEYKFKSKPGTSVVSSPAEKDSQQVDRRAVSGRGPTKGQEESAVHGPSYKFQGAKEISVEDSILLQKQQREHLQSIQTQHAAERLAERLNVKTVDYSPPSLDMSYRSSDVTDDADINDSDDVPDEEEDDDLLD